jgi:membrane protease YdiL (CAAX protease family)
LQKQNRAEAQRRRAALALAGAICGVLIGHFGTGDVWPAALIGFAVGGLIGLLWRKHV